jgi:predicted ATPase
MKRYVLTGAPGAGKTSVLGALQARGFAVVAEAATDVISERQGHGIAEPWQQDDFIDGIVALQRDRLGPAAASAAGAAGAAEVARVVSAGAYERAVFLVRPIGFIVPTAARRISYQDSLGFERLHEAAYREHGFEIIGVAAAPVAERAAVIADEITARA